MQQSIDALAKQSDVPSSTSSTASAASLSKLNQQVSNLSASVTGNQVYINPLDGPITVEVGYKESPLDKVERVWVHRDMVVKINEDGSGGYLGVENGIELGRQPMDAATNLPSFPPGYTHAAIGSDHGYFTHISTNGVTRANYKIYPHYILSMDYNGITVATKDLSTAPDSNFTNIKQTVVSAGRVSINVGGYQLNTKNYNPDNTAIPESNLTTYAELDMGQWIVNNFNTTMGELWHPTGGAFPKITRLYNELHDTPDGVLNKIALLRTDLTDLTKTDGRINTLEKGLFELGKAIALKAQRGEKGEKGEKGDTGPAGPAGPAG
jgi:hypothetical protein